MKFLLQIIDDKGFSFILDLVIFLVVSPLIYKSIHVAHHLYIMLAAGDSVNLLVPRS